MIDGQKLSLESGAEYVLGREVGDKKRNLYAEVVLGKQ